MSCRDAEAHYDVESRQREYCEKNDAHEDFSVFLELRENKHQCRNEHHVDQDIQQDILNAVFHRILVDEFFRQVTEVLVEQYVIADARNCQSRQEACKDLKCLFPGKEREQRDPDDEYACRDKAAADEIENRIACVHAERLDELRGVLGDDVRRDHDARKNRKDRA